MSWVTIKPEKFYFFLSTRIIYQCFPSSVLSRNYTLYSYTPLALLTLQEPAQTMLTLIRKINGLSMLNFLLQFLTPPMSSTMILLCVYSLVRLMSVSFWRRLSCVRKFGRLVLSITPSSNCTSHQNHRRKHSLEEDQSLHTGEVASRQLMNCFLKWTKLFITKRGLPHIHLKDHNQVFG